jgi:polar amino acid transport system substrate-binding protein/arginine/ornithine transport system substrate-binding protein
MRANHFISTLIVAILSLGLSFSASADVLRIGVEGAYKPFSWKEADGTLKGFDIDIAMALCAEMKRECKLVEQDWDGIIPALMAKKYDAIIASMSITDERKKQVDFSVKYYNTPGKFVVAKGSDITISKNGLKGKRVGVQRGTTHQCNLEKMFPGAEVVMYATQEEVFQDLAIGRIDAQISDSIAADEGFLMTDAGKDFEFKGADQTDMECYGEGAGIAVRKQDGKLKGEFNKAIKAIRENGTYQKINAKYFDFDIYGG